MTDERTERQPGADGRSRIGGGIQGMPESDRADQVTLEILARQNKAILDKLEDQRVQIALLNNRLLTLLSHLGQL